MDSFNVENIGDVSLNFINDLSQEWYLDIKTELGDTVVTKFGPLLIDINELQNSFKFERNKFSYNETKLINEIDKILTNDKLAITQVMEIDRDTFNNRLREIIDGCAS